MISSVVLVRAGSVTHAFDMDQRVIGLNFTQSGGTLTVNLPPNPNVVPPGYYMLFVLNSTGVPSVAKFLQVSPFPTDTPPKGTMTAPTTVVNIKAGQSVIFNGTASDSDGTVTTTSWYFPGGTPNTSTVPNPGAVTFASAGTFTCSLTAVDNLGVNDPSPPFHTITVSPAVTIANPKAGSSVTGTVQVQAGVAGALGSSNTFTFTLDNTVLGTQKVQGTGASFSWITTQASKGAHNLSVKVQDQEGDIGSANESVTVY
jgi:hypothetical protein